jgi:outer membrane protein assembly factor BamB
VRRHAGKARAGLGVALLFGAGCRDSASIEPTPPPPTLSAVQTESNPLNALTAAVTFRVQRADSARVIFRGDGGQAGASPFYPLGDGAAKIVVLGLAPSTRYHGAVIAEGPGGVTTSDSVAFQTSDIPPSLSGVRLDLSGSPPPGYIVTEISGDTTAATVAFDTAGRVRWYRSFTTHPGEFAMQTEQLSTGDFTVYVGGSTGWQPVGGRFIEFRPDGEIVRSYAAGAPYYTDSHELLLSVTAGTVSAAHIYGYELRVLDLTALGGRPDQLVAGHTLLRQSASGATEFLWNAWDHFSIADWVFIPPNLASYPSIDFDHPNSLAIDHDGNYVVSFAGLGEITCIDAVTGQILWRFGGRHNQFTILGDPLGGFGFQHDVRVLHNGDLLFFDNGLAHAPQQSRAVQYHLDLRAMTATLVWEYRPDPPIFAPFVGSVQRFQNGNTLVGFGPAAIMTEVTPTGQVVWEGRLTVNGQPVPYFYRARRIASLYRYASP